MRRVLDWAGRTLLVAGVLTLLFVAYQFWGTGLVQDWEQRSLARDFDARIEDAAVERPRGGPSAPDAAGRSGPSTTSTTTTTTPPPVLGEPVARLEIPAIGLDQVVVEGADRDELRKGPGHYPHSPLPGRAGNAAIAGHRTTYGAPFFDLDDLAVGDEIVATTPEGAFTYVVAESVVVGPDDVSVVLDRGDHRLTLTTCHPKYSAEQRLVVSAILRGDPVGGPEPDASEPPATIPGDEPADAAADASAERARAAPVDHLDEAAGGLGGVGLATLLWTLALLAVGGGWWWSFRHHPRWYTWVWGALPFLFVSFFFFGEVERLLPGGY